jgi:hypothetical protein
MSRAGSVGVVLLLAAAGTAAVWAAESRKAAVDSRKAASESFRYDSRGRRDPFAPLVRDGRLIAVTSGPRVESSKPVLYGILWDPEGRSIALINDIEAKVGDTIAGYQVMEIRKDAVVLEGGGEPLVLEIAFDTPPSKLSTGTPKGGERP